MKEEDFGLVAVEIVIDKDFGKSETEIEIFESMKDLKVPRECDADFPIIINDLADINGKDKNHPRVQAKLKRSRHNIKSVFKVSQYNRILRK